MFSWIWLQTQCLLLLRQNMWGSLKSVYTLHTKRRKKLQKKKTAPCDKINYDLKARNSVLSLGDLVLVKNVGLHGKHKTADMWEHKPYVVVSQPNQDMPMYEVKDTSTRARKTRLPHRILLLPFMGLPRVKQSEETENVPSSPEQIGTSPNNSPVSIPDNYSSSESSSGISSGGSYSSDDERSMSEMPYMMILVIRVGIEQRPSWSKGSSGQAWMHLSRTRSRHVIDAFCKKAEEGWVQSWWISRLVHRWR